jgi:hypothetical protein
VPGQVADVEQQIVERVGRSEAEGPPLELVLERVGQLRIEELAHLSFTEQRTELVGIDQEGLRAPLGQGRVSVVEEVSHEREEQALRERRRDLRVHHAHGDLARLDALEDGHEAGHVERVGEALAVHLEHERKLGEA